MFSFFLSGAFFDFWGNKPGDIFYDNTVKKMNWDNSLVSLYYYPGIPVKRPELFAFDENKNLLIQEKQVTILDGIEVEELVTISTITAEAFVVNGEKLAAC
jgi:hypothetical protein